MAVYKKGDIVKGLITGIEDYGAFVAFDDGYTGLIHISEISSGFVSDITSYFKLGDEIESEVIDVDDENKKLKLSIKYRTKDNDSSKKIKEVGSGFDILRDNLGGWIDDKMTEINEKSD